MGLGLGFNATSKHGLRVMIGLMRFYVDHPVLRYGSCHTKWGTLNPNFENISRA